jgi:ABC-type nitrate/sulfonate/bicarbonate transport system substrate-binding protein
MAKTTPVTKLPYVLTGMAIVLSMFLAAAASEGATLSRLRVGYPSPSASFFPLFATKEAGLLEKYGFDTEMVYVQGVGGAGSCCRAARFFDDFFRGLPSGFR